MSNPIAFLLGAGASVHYGVPSMAPFYKAFREHLQRRHPDHFKLLERFEAAGRHAAYDLETLLSDLQLATSAMEGRGLLGLPNEGTGELTVQLAELRGFLDTFVIDACERFERERSAQELNTILQMRELGPLWIFSTNYDRVVEHACEQNQVTFSDGFTGGNGKTVADWNGDFSASVRLAKLHGSVNWYQDNPGPGLHRLDRGYPLPSHEFGLVRNDQRLTPLMIIPTLEKQVLTAPYTDLSVKLNDELKTLPLLIVAGSSLRDQHLLNYIRVRLPRLHVLLVSPNANTLRVRLNLGPSVHSLDVGFQDFLISAKTLLPELGNTITENPAPERVGAEVETFAIRVKSAATSQATLEALPEFQAFGKLLSSASQSERVRGINELGATAHPALIERFTVLLKNDLSESVRTAASSTLIRMGSAESLEAAKVGLSDKSQAVQLETVLGLLKRNDTETNKVLLNVASLCPAAQRIVNGQLGTKIEEVTTST